MHSLPLSQPACATASHCRAVQAAVSPHCVRRPLRRLLSSHSNKHKVQQPHRVCGVRALQAEREKPATPKRGRPKKEARPQLPLVRCLFLPSWCCILAQLLTSCVWFSLAHTNRRSGNLSLLEDWAFTQDNMVIIRAYCFHSKFITTSKLALKMLNQWYLVAGFD